jgi:hypothetical protein
MPPGLTCDINGILLSKERATGVAKGPRFSDQCPTQMPLKVALSHFSLKELGSYSRFRRRSFCLLSITIMQCYDLVCVQLAKFLVLVPCTDF